MKRVAKLAIAAVLMAGCGDSDPDVATRATLEPLQIHADSDWIRDRGNRVVLLRGVNYSGLEFGNFIGNTHGPEASDFAQIASWGVNVVRLPIAWAYIEPQPNQFDETYLADQVDKVIAFAAEHGLAVILDMHFYYWSACVGGLGAPAWVCDGHGYPQGDTGLFRATCDFFRGISDPDRGAKAADGRFLYEHFLDAWRVVVRHYASNSTVIGWDYFNEPYGTCYGLFTRQFEPQALHPLYRRMREIARAEGGDRTFFYEPPVTRNLGLTPALESMGPDVVYAPHLYANTAGMANVKYDGNTQALAADFGQAVQEAALLGGPLVVGEYGGNAGGGAGFPEATALFLRDTYAEMDRRLAGGTAWAYFPGDNGFSVVDAEGKEKDDSVNYIARPYARRTAGIPTAMSWDPQSKELNFAFRNDAGRQASDPTEIFIPAARHYPAGFDVEVSGGDQWEYDAANNRILMYRGAATEHTLRLTAR